MLHAYLCGARRSVRGVKVKCISCFASGQNVLKSLRFCSPKPASRGRAGPTAAVQQGAPSPYCHFLLRGIFPTEESSPGLLHCRQMLYRLSHQGSPWQFRRCKQEMWARKIVWRRKWQPTPVLACEISCQRSLIGYSPWVEKESAMTEQLSTVKNI